MLFSDLDTFALLVVHLRLHHLCFLTLLNDLLLFGGQLKLTWWIVFIPVLWIDFVSIAVNGDLVDSLNVLCAEHLDSLDLAELPVDIHGLVELHLCHFGLNLT